MTKLIDKNTTIPTKANQIFSTAEDNQTAVTVHVLQGEREMALANKSLGRFDLTDIPPAPRGMPQIEVTFDIDANGILHVSAKNKATGKEQSIVIKASSGLSDEEVKKMVKDAEAHRETDLKFHKLVDARNQADTVIHTVEKSMKDLEAAKVTIDEKDIIEKAIRTLKEEIKGNDRDAIEEKTKALTEYSSKLVERVYASKKGSAGDPSGSKTGSKESRDENIKKEDVVDAEFEEVKDEKKGDEDKK